MRTSIAFKQLPREEINEDLTHHSNMSKARLFLFTVHLFSLFLLRHKKCSCFQNSYANNFKSPALISQRRSSKSVTFSRVEGGEAPPPYCFPPPLDFFFISARPSRITYCTKVTYLAASPVQRSRTQSRLLPTFAITSVLYCTLVGLSIVDRSLLFLLLYFLSLARSPLELEELLAFVQSPFLSHKKSLCGITFDVSLRSVSYTHFSLINIIKGTFLFFPD